MNRWALNVFVSPEITTRYPDTRQLLFFLEPFPMLNNTLRKAIINISFQTPLLILSLSIHIRIGVGNKNYQN